MSLLDTAISYLEERNIPTALIGGMAMAALGVARATLDFDLLVADGRVLDAGFWGAFPGSKPGIRPGDPSDPLAGVVRWEGPSEPVDLVVVREAWKAAVLSRRTRIEWDGREIPIVEAADLVLLKLDAGGPQDLVDVRLLLESDRALAERVRSRLAGLPSAIRESWNRLEKT